MEGETWLLGLRGQPFGAIVGGTQGRKEEERERGKEAEGVSFLNVRIRSISLKTLTPPFFF